MKTAVILMNLGGPDSLNSVKSFLFNLFYDKSIITLPNPLRWIIAKIISTLRNKKAQEIYKLVGGASPIMQETIAQKKALEQKLEGRDIEIFIVMRHYHPMSLEVVKKIKLYNPDEIIMLPLYPQFSTTTTGSAVADLKNSLSIEACLVPQKVICCYFKTDGFVAAHAELILSAMEKIIDKDNMCLLFSAHGLPKKVVLNGDPYQWQIEESVKAIVKKLSIKKLDYKISYQSKVGPLEWLTPNTEDEIKEAAIAGKAILVVPIAFVSEHVETLVELDLEYSKIAKDANVEYIRVPALSINDKFIESLADLIINAQENAKIPKSAYCSKNFAKCLCR